MSQSKPNILFLVLDGLSGEKFFGETKTSKTPNIDSWIKQGVYFSQTICSAQGTVPTVSSLLTSLYPFECVVQAEETYIINPKIKTFIHYLKESLHQMQNKLRHYCHMKESLKCQLKDKVDGAKYWYVILRYGIKALEASIGRNQ